MIPNCNPCPVPLPSRPGEVLPPARNPAVRSPPICCSGPVRDNTASCRETGQGGRKLSWKKGTDGIAMIFSMHLNGKFSRFRWKIRLACSRLFFAVAWAMDRLMIPLNLQIIRHTAYAVMQDSDPGNAFDWIRLPGEMKKMAQIMGTGCVIQSLFSLNLFRCRLLVKHACNGLNDGYLAPYVIA